MRANHLVGVDSDLWDFASPHLSFYYDYSIYLDAKFVDGGILYSLIF